MKNSVFSLLIVLSYFLSFPGPCRGGETERVWPAPYSFRWHWLAPEAAPKDPSSGFEEMAGARMWLRDGKYPSWLMDGEEAFYPGPPVSGISLRRDKDGNTTGLSVETGMVLLGLEGHYDAGPFSFFFKGWKGQELYHFPDSKFEAKWGLKIYSADSAGEILFTEEKHARSLARIIFSFASSAGYPVTPGLGLETKDLSAAQAKEIGWKAPSGALVLSAAHGGPADKAGLLPLDVITHSNGAKIKNNAHFRRMAADKVSGGKLNLSLLRRGPDGGWKREKAVLTAPLFSPLNPRTSPE